MELGNGGDAYDWVFLAMALHRAGQPSEARGWYDKAVASLGQKPEDEELRRFREEAAALLGVDRRGQ